MSENRDRIYPEFPRRNGFVEADVKDRADKTRAALAEFAFPESEEYHEDA